MKKHSGNGPLFRFDVRKFLEEKKLKPAAEAFVFFTVENKKK